MSFVLGELGCSYKEYCEMTWNEYQIRLFSYHRQDKNKWLMLRELMYNNSKAPHLDPKKIPKTIKAFMNMGEKKTGLNDFQRTQMIKAQKEYNNRHNK